MSESCPFERKIPSHMLIIFLQKAEKSLIKNDWRRLQTNWYIRRKNKTPPDFLRAGFYCVQDRNSISDFKKTQTLKHFYKATDIIPSRNWPTETESIKNLHCVNFFNSRRVCIVAEIFQNLFAADVNQRNFSDGLIIVLCKFFQHNVKRRRKTFNQLVDVVERVILNRNVRQIIRSEYSKFRAQNFQSRWISEEKYFPRLCADT